MQGPVPHTINFNLRKSNDKQIDVAEVELSTVSFTGSFPQILRSLELFSRPVQPSIRPNAVWPRDHKT
jgi:hypothetical protein